MNCYNSSEKSRKAGSQPSDANGQHTCDQSGQPKHSGSQLRAIPSKRVRGTIQKKVTKEITFKGYKRHASEEEPQYIIKSDKIDHLAIHKGSALKKIKKRKG